MRTWEKKIGRLRMKISHTMPNSYEEMNQIVLALREVADTIERAVRERLENDR